MASIYKTPESVTQYLDAQWWMFLHWGLPLIGLALLLAAAVLLVKAFQDYGAHEDDEEDDGAPLDLHL